MLLGSFDLIQYITLIRTNRHSSIIWAFWWVGGLRPCLFCLFRGGVQNLGKPAYIILERSLLWNGHILANKLIFEQLCTLSFHQFSKLEKIKCPYFCLFWLISQNTAILVILLDYCSKSLFYSAFFKILTKKGNFVKIYLYSSSLEPT